MPKLCDIWILNVLILVAVIKWIAHNEALIERESKVQQPCLSGETVLAFLLFYLNF